MPGFCDLNDGFLGIFGEGGLEALHPKYSLCIQLVRQMRNPEARHKAHTRHLEAMTSTAVMGWVVHRRGTEMAGVAQGAERAERAGRDWRIRVEGAWLLQTRVLGRRREKRREKRWEAAAVVWNDQPSHTGGAFAYVYIVY